MPSRRRFLGALSALAAAFAGGWWGLRRKPAEPVPGPPAPATAPPEPLKPFPTPPDFEAPYVPSFLHPDGRSVLLPDMLSPKGEGWALWDLDTGRRTRSIEGAQGGSSPLSGDRQLWSRDGRAVLDLDFTPNDPREPLCCRLDPMELIPRKAWPPELVRYIEESSLAEAKSLDGRWAAAVEEPTEGPGKGPAHPAAFTLLVREPQAGAVRARGRITLPSPPFHLEFSPSGRTLGVLSKDGTFATWEWSRPEAQPVLRGRIQAGSHSFTGLLVTDEGRAWAGYAGIGMEGRPYPEQYLGFVVLPDAVLHRLGTGGLDGLQLALGRDGNRLAVRYGLATVRDYDPATGKLRRLLTTAMPRTGLVAWGPDAHHLLIARAGDHPCLWDRRGKTIEFPGGLVDQLVRPPHVALFDTTEPMSGGSQALAWSPDGRTLAAGRAGGTVGLWQRNAVPPIPQRLEDLGPDHQQAPAAAGRTFAGPEDQAEVRALAFLPGRLAALHRNGEVRIWSLDRGALERSWTADPTQANALATTGDLLATGGNGGVCLWDPATGALKGEFSTEGHWVAGLHAQGGLLAAATTEGALRVFDIASKRLLWSAEAHEGWASGLAFHPGGGLLASGGEDGRVVLWDARSGARLREAQVDGHTLAWSRDGRWLAANGLDRVRILTQELRHSGRPADTFALDWADEYT